MNGRLRVEVGRVAAVAWKDLTAERRTRANANAVLFFSVLVLVLFGFAFGPDADALRAAAPGVLWLTVLFSGVLAFNRSYQVELENGAFDVLLLYPGDRRAIFLGKVVANLVFVLAIEALVVPLAAVLYGLPLLAALPGLAAVVLLATFGLVTVGTFYGAMASRVRAREVLLPLLLFPIVIPLLVAAVEGTTAVLAGDPMGEAGAWIRLLVVFDLVFFIACVLAFEHVIEE